MPTQISHTGPYNLTADQWRVYLVETSTYWGDVFAVEIEREAWDKMVKDYLRHNKKKGRKQ